MLSDERCNYDQSKLYYSAYSDTSSWGVRCATKGRYEDCTEQNENWQEYIVRFENRRHRGILRNSFAIFLGGGETSTFFQFYRSSHVDVQIGRKMVRLIDLIILHKLETNMILPKTLKKFS